MKLRLLILVGLALVSLESKPQPQCFYSGQVQACVTLGAASDRWYGDAAISTTDPLAAQLALVMELKLTDGSMFAVRRTLAASPVLGEPVHVSFYLGELVPAAVSKLYVVRMYQQPPDFLVGGN